MNDYQIRTALKRALSRRYANDTETVIIEELGLGHGAARIDLVVVNSCLHGYEIKSDLDTLDRLPEQARIYNSALDRITLVVGYHHAYQAVKIVPEWWGIKIAEKGLRGSVRFLSLRMPSNNRSTDILSVAKLLWRTEAMALLDEMASAAGVRSKPRELIYQELVKVADLESIRSRVRRQLRCRANWRFVEQQRLNGD